MRWDGKTIKMPKASIVSHFCAPALQCGVEVRRMGGGDGVPYKKFVSGGGKVPVSTEAVADELKGHIHTGLERGGRVGTGAACGSGEDGSGE